MEENIFECAGFKNNVRFRFEKGFIFVTELPEKDALIINENDLTGIRCANYSWMSQCSIMNTELTFLYEEKGRQKTQSVILNNRGKDLVGLLTFLKNRYREMCFVGPTKKERSALLASEYVGLYKLHSLHILTLLGVISGFLFIFVFVLYLMIATTNQTIINNPGKMNLAGLIVLILSLPPLGTMYLIEEKRFMVVRTDWQGITVRKFFCSRHYSWEKVIVKTPQSGIHNVYRGLYCEASNRGEVVAARALINIRLSVAGKEDATLLMSVDEAGRFYRELYYRNKISLDEANQIGAFL